MLTRIGRYFSGGLVHIFDSFFTDFELISKYMYFTDNSCILKYRYEVLLTWKYLRWYTESEKSEYRSVHWINHLKKPLMSSWCLIKIFINNGIMRTIALGTYFTSRYIMSSDASCSHSYLRDLPQIGNLGSCKYLRSRDITIHSIEPNILRNQSLDLSHKRYKCRIIIWDKFSSLPYFGEFWVGRHNQWIDLEFIRAKIRILKYLSHWCNISIWSRSHKSWHHMSHHFESCIFEESRCADRLRISMTTLVESIDTIICRLISDLNSCDTISSQTDYLILIDPVRTCLDRNPNDTTFGRFISFFCLFQSRRFMYEEILRILRCLMLWKWTSLSGHSTQHFQLRAK